MKHLNKIIVLPVLMALCMLASSCKDDNDSVAQPPSRVVEQVKVYNKKGGSYDLATIYSFKYDTNGRLLKVESGTPFMEVNYSYDKNEFSYTHVYEQADGSKEVNKVSSTLDNDRMVMCTSKVLGNSIYAYNGRTGLISQVSVGNDMVMSYDWQPKLLWIKAFSNTNPSVGKYSARFNYSDVSNNYSIDLNALLQLMDERELYVEIMNSYAALAGVLGEKFGYVLESEFFTYNYGYDKEGRLMQVMIVSRLGNMADYTFVIKYKENE